MNCRCLLLPISLLLASCLPVQAEQHLWDTEPSYWSVAQTYQLVRPLPAQFGIEGPATSGADNAQVTAGNPQGAPGINLSNGKLKLSLWGPANQLTVSISKTDVYDRTSPHGGTSWTWEEGHSPRPVGQLLLMADDFAGAAQPSVSTAIKNAANTFHLSQGGASADLTYLSSRSDSNVIVIDASYTGLTKPVSVRVFNFSHPGLDAQPGEDGSMIWLRQTLPADKTFPQGFTYYLAAEVVGAQSTHEIAKNAPGLGSPVYGQNAGSAATAHLAVSGQAHFIVYATVVTLAEATDPLALARSRLDAARRRGLDQWEAANQQWFQSMYIRRERGRIFTGELAPPLKDILMPYFYQGSWQNRHTYLSSPDPSKYETDGCYAGLEMPAVPWYGSPCFNEEMYTNEFVAGRDETIVPYYVTLVNFWHDAWVKHAAAAGKAGMFFVRGYVPPMANDSYFSFDQDAMTGNDWGTMAFCYKNVWDEYDYGGRDNQFLRDQVYPGLRDGANFFCSLVKMGDDGFYHIDACEMRENEFGKDAQDCVATAKWFWQRASEASFILQVDAQSRDTWQSFRKKMKPYYLMPDGSFGGIIENGAVRQFKGLQHFAVNVTDEFNLDSSKEDQERAYNSCDHVFLGANVPHLLGRDRDTFTGGVANWFWMFNRTPWLMYYAIKQMGIGINGETHLDTPLQKTVACWFEPERLCNSRGGTIYFFPCVPTNFDVAFRDFQARGGFLVTGELRQGKVTYAQIIARRTTTCVVSNPWPGQKLSVYQFPENIAMPTSHTAEKYLFAAQAGKTYLLRP